MKNKILITGGAGFIGINLAKHYLDKNFEVIIFDNFSRKGSRDNVKWLQRAGKNNLMIIEADIVKDKNKLEEVVKDCEIVFHLAAQVAVTSSIIDPVYDFNVNALGTLRVLEAIRAAKNNAILFYASTNKVYGDIAHLKVSEQETRYVLKNYPFGISEKQTIKFIAPYGCSKGAADQYVHDYHTMYGLRTVIFRQSCIYGPYQFGIEDQGWIAWFVIALLLHKEITIYGNGKQVRDLLYIDDLVQAFDLAIAHIEKTSGNIYNIGGGMKNTISVWVELKGMLEKIFQREIIAKFAEERPGDQKIYVSDIRKAKADFKWKPKVSIEDGLLQLFTWAKENKPILETHLL